MIGVASQPDGNTTCCSAESGCVNSGRTTSPEESGPCSSF